MVNGVGNGPGYNYTQIAEKKINTNASGTGEKFQLDYGKDGAIYEPGSEAIKRQQEQKTESSGRKLQEVKGAEDEGVRLTLSDAALETVAETSKTEQNASGGILDTVTNVVNKTIEVIKNFFNKIWNDEPQKEVELSEDTTTIEKPKTQFDKAKAEAEAFLASTEGKKAARNSDLLTYYDKRGIVVNVSPSDRQRILYGDKNQIEV